MAILAGLCTPPVLRCDEATADYHPTQRQRLPVCSRSSDHQRSAKQSHALYHAGWDNWGDASLRYFRQASDMPRAGYIMHAEHREYPHPAALTCASRLLLQAHAAQSALR